MRIYPEYTVDQEFKTLGDIGLSGSLNDRQFSFLRARGFKNSLTDMMSLWLSSSPASLFANNEAGVWYDPSQAANLDWLRNLLTWTEQFDNAAWSKGNTTVTPNQIGDADLFTTTGSDSVSRSISVTSGATVTYSEIIKRGNHDWVRLTFLNGANELQAWYNLATGAVGTSKATGTASLSGATITAEEDGFYRCILSGSVPSATSYTIVSATAAADNTFTRAATGSTRYHAGAQLELGSTATEYQRITDVNTEVMERFPEATLFQDTAGTTPVTTAGQTVGLMLDKSGNGNHATQATAASRPTYGIVPFGGRRNLLTFTEQFDNAAWLKSSITTVSANASVAPDGTTTADLITSGGAAGYIYPTTGLFAAAGGATYTYSAYFKAGTATTVQLLVAATATYLGTYNLSTGVATTASANTTVSMVDVGSGWYRCVITCASVANTAYTEAQIGRVALGLTFSLWGAQLEQGSTATAYQRVTTQYDVTEAGVPPVAYLAFDGVDDFMVTPTITPNTDKVQVFAGLRKLSDAAVGMVVELSANSGGANGSLYLIAPNSTSAAGYEWRSRGTTAVQATAGSGFASPITSVLTGLGDISGDTATLRIDGTQAAQSTADQGTGNYLAYPLYIGRRGGTSVPFNGQLYSLVTRFGSNLEAYDIANTETYAANKTGVTL